MSELLDVVKKAEISEVTEVEQMEQRMDQMEDKMENMEEKMETLEEKIEVLEGKREEDEMEVRMDEMEEKIEMMEDKMETMEHKIEDLEGKDERPVRVGEGSAPLVEWTVGNGEAPEADHNCNNKVNNHRLNSTVYVNNPSIFDTITAGPSSLVNCFQKMHFWVKKRN